MPLKNTKEMTSNYLIRTNAYVKTDREHAALAATEVAKPLRVLYKYDFDKIFRKFYNLQNVAPLSDLFFERRKSSFQASGD